MEVDYALLADSVEVVSRRFNVFGAGITRVSGKEFPFKHSAMSLVVGLKLHPPEFNRQHRLEIQLWDPDGRRLAEFEASFSAPPPDGTSPREAIVPLIWNIGEVEFLAPGLCAFYILVNGEQKKRVSLDAVISTAQNMP